MKKELKKLGKRNYTLISNAVNTMGTFDPNKITFLFEESLNADEYDEIVKFLSWVHNNNKMFGSGNYEQVFSEYKLSDKNVPSLSAGEKCPHCGYEDNHSWMCASCSKRLDTKSANKLTLVKNNG